MSKEIKVDVELVPRSFQRIIYEQACKRNIIAVLETGSGKTFIASMLIKHVIQKDISQNKKKRMAFFLVNQVPLVTQQATFIKQTTGLKVGYVWGEMKINLKDVEKWEQLYEMVDVIVMTASILHQVLVHGFIAMKDINLLVIDECHHTRKKHPYNLIMKEFYFAAAVKDRPKVFGMTASPFNPGLSVQDSIIQLEQSLDGVVSTVLPHLDKELKLAVPKAIERVIRYEACKTECYLTEIFDKYFPNLNEDFVFCRRVLITLKYTIQELGPWCCDKIVRDELYEEMKRLEKAKRSLNSKLVKSKDEERVILAKMIDDINLHTIELDKSTMSPKVLTLVQILEMASSCNKDKFSCLAFVERRYTAFALKNMLLKYFANNPAVRADVIVGNTKSFDHVSIRNQNVVLNRFRNGTLNVLIATAVAEEGIDVPVCSLVIRFDVFQNLVSFVQSRGRARNQKSLYVVLVKENDERQLELLSQIRENEIELQKIREFRAKNPQLFFEEDPETSIDSMEDDDDENLVLSPKDNEFFTVPSTGATVSLNSSIPLIYHYCQRLAVDDYMEAVPEFVTRKINETTFICKLLLPNPSAIRVVEGNKYLSKVLAKRSAALEACKRLYHNDSLNDHLLPKVVRNKKEKEAKVNDLGRLLHGIKIDKKDLPEMKELTADLRWKTLTPYVEPNWFKIKDKKIWLYAFDSKGKEKEARFASFGVLLYNKMEWFPGFPLYFAEGEQHTRVDFETIEVPIPYDILKLNKIKRLNSFLMRYVYLSHRDHKDKLDNEAGYIWQKVDFSKWDESYAFLFVPWKKNLLGQIEINWEMIDYIFEAEKLFRDSPDEMSICLPIIKQLQTLFPKVTSEENFVATDLIDYQKRVVVEEIKSNMTPFSKVVHNDVEPGSQWPPFVKDYISGYLLWHRRIPYSKARINNTTIDQQQPMFKISRVPPFQSFLKPSEQVAEMRGKSKLPNHRIPQFQVFNPIPYSIYRSFLAFPSVCHLIHSFWLISKMREKFGLYEIPHKYLLESLTTPAAGFTFDYERLEILGDAFLKISISNDLFLRYLEKQEGQLSYSRHLMVSNKAIYRRASSKNVHEYIISSVVQAKEWRLPTSKTTVSDGVAFSGSAKADMEQARRYAGGAPNVVVDWVVADVMEAVFGAAVVAGGIELAFKIAPSFGFLFEGISTWSDYKSKIETYFHSIAKDEDLIRSIKREEIFQLVPKKEIENILGYEFNNERLLDMSFNHESSPYRTVSSYQRLEYLGDAVLDYIVVNMLFNVNAERQTGIDGFPVENFGPLKNSFFESKESKAVQKGFTDLGPGEITHLKAFIVSNDTLAFVSVSVGLDRYLQSFSDALLKSVGIFRTWTDGLVNEPNDKASTPINAPFLPWWWDEIQRKTKFLDNSVFLDSTLVRNGSEANKQSNSLEPKDLEKFLPNKFPEAPPPAPKVLSDIFEAIIGAVYLDCKMNLQVVMKVLQKTLRLFSNNDAKGSFQEWLRKNPTEALYHKLHPIRRIQEWFDQRKCEGLTYKEFPLSKRVITSSMILDTDIACVVEDDVEFDFSTIHFLKDADTITESTSPFKLATIGIYWHGILIGVGHSRSSKVAKYSAAQQAKMTISSMVQKGIFITKDYHAEKNVSDIDKNTCPQCSGVPESGYQSEDEISNAPEDFKFDIPIPQRRTSFTSVVSALSAGHTAEYETEGYTTHYETEIEDENADLKSPSNCIEGH